jgi:hypothetical protein
MTLQICNNGCLFALLPALQYAIVQMTFPAADVINSARYGAKDLVDALPVERAACRRR